MLNAFWWNLINSQALSALYLQASLHHQSPPPGPVSPLSPLGIDYHHPPHSLTTTEQWRSLLTKAVAERSKLLKLTATALESNLVESVVDGKVEIDSGTNHKEASLCGSSNSSVYTSSKAACVCACVCVIRID